MAIALPLALPAILGSLVVGLVVRTLLALGFTVASFVGITALWDTLETALWANLGQTSASILTILAMARIDDAIKLVLSAAGAVLVWRGLTAPIIRRLLFIGVS